MQCRFFVEDLPVAASVIQKQWNQSLSIQKQSLKGVLIKRCSEIGSKFAGEQLCQSGISM